MAPKKYSGTDYIYASQLSELSAREIGAEMDRVFRDANNRLAKLYESAALSAKGVNVDEDVRAVSNLITAIKNTQFPLSSRSDTKIFRVGADRAKMDMTDQLRAYQVAVDFLRDKSSTVQGAINNQKTARENLERAFHSGRDYAVSQLGRKGVRGKDYLESLERSKPKLYDDGEKADNAVYYTVMGVEKKVTIKKDDGLYTVLGHILNSVRSSLDDISINASDGVTVANSNNQYYTRFVDVLSKYFYSQEEYTLDEMVQKAVDEFIELRSASKGANGTSSAPSSTYRGFKNRGSRRR